MSFADAVFELLFARFCDDPLVADDSDTFASRLSFEKSNFLRTDADTEGTLDSRGERREGEVKRPIEGFLRAGDCKKVLMGDLERGGGRRIPDRCCLSVRTAVGSGMVPEGK